MQYLKSGRNNRSQNSLLVRNKLFAGRRGLNRQPLSENTSSQPLITGKKEGLEVAAIALSAII